MHVPATEEGSSKPAPAPGPGTLLASQFIRSPCLANRSRWPRSFSLLGDSGIFPTIAIVSKSAYPGLVSFDSNQLPVIRWLRYYVDVFFRHYCYPGEKSHRALPSHQLMGLRKQSTKISGLISWKISLSERYGIQLVNRIIKKLIDSVSRSS